MIDSFIGTSINGTICIALPTDASTHLLFFFFSSQSFHRLTLTQLSHNPTFSQGQGKANPPTERRTLSNFVLTNMALSTTTTTFQSSSSSSLRGSSNRNGKSGSHAIMERLLLSLVLVSFALLAMSASTGEQLRTAVPSIANIHNTRTTVTSSQTRRLSSSPTTHNNNNNNDVYETSSPPTVVSDLAWLEQHILKPLVVDIGVVMLCHMVGMPAFVQVGGLLQKVRHVVRPLSKIKLPLVRRLQKTVSKLYKNRQRMAAASDLTHLIEEDCDGSICSLAQ